MSETHTARRAASDIASVGQADLFDFGGVLADIGRSQPDGMPEHAVAHLRRLDLGAHRGCASGRRAGR
jgi:hypothetical protein